MWINQFKRQKARKAEGRTKVMSRQAAKHIASKKRTI